MLRVDTYLKNIEGKGISLISNEKIKKGSTVWVFDPMLDIIIPSSIVKSIKKTDHSGNFTKLIETYSAYDKTKDCYYLSIDNCRFINHSSQPNIEEDPLDNERFIAKHNIMPGDEITIDYEVICDIDRENGTPENYI
tara:strand:+ start:341 stop:751 length:411 start_codon:yes stop_codon:yes gene_type:complete